MSSSDIPPDVRRFVANVVPSVPFLEAILLLHEDPEVGWNAQGLSERLYISRRKAEQLLRALRKAGLAMSHGTDDTYCCVRDAQVRAVLDSVSEVYARHIVEISGLIHSKIDTNAQRFADAFKLRKD